MATSVNYTGDGVTTNFTIPFSYLSESFVKASINTIDTSNFTLLNPSTVAFNTAPAPGSQVRIYRETPTDQLLVQANPGSALRAQDVELNARQNLDAVQELETFILAQSNDGLAGSVAAANLNAATALTAASTALATAGAAETTANGIAGTVSAANTTAGNAVTTATNALTVANNAQNTASTALSLITGSTAPGDSDRNLIINGAFTVSDFGFGPNSNVGTRATNRWGFDQSLNVLEAQVFESGGPNRLLRNYLRTRINFGDTLIDPTDRYAVFQVVEGNRAARLGWGTASAIPATLSFWVRSNVPGTYSVCLQNSAKDRSLIGSYTINAADTWEQKTVAVPAITTGTWLTDTGKGIQLSFVLAAGSNFHDTAGAWITGNKCAVAGQADGVGTTGNTFDLSGVQLEGGSSATTFELLSLPQVQIQCARYSFYLSDLQYRYQIAGQRTEYIYFPVPMRVAPDVDDVSKNLSNMTGFSYTSITTRGFGMRFTSSSNSASILTIQAIRAYADYAP